MADFKSAVKQRLFPQLTAGPTSAPNSITAGANTAKPQMSFSGQSAIRLGIGEILAPGGTQTVSDIGNSYWFSANKPVTPVAGAGYRPRQNAFIPGANMLWTPGEDKGGVDFGMLRILADSWDMLRLVIETRKDQICSMPWEIRAKQVPGETNADRKERSLKDPNIKQLQNFFNFPDGFHNWKTWLRMWFEDMLVLDAVALYKVRDEDGKIASVMPLDGATICRLLTDQGITPTAPDAAYQQIVYGSPACDLTTDDLLYAMRNERTHKRYGYSPVEQILVTIGIGLRKQMFLTNYYTDGNMPEALCFLPPSIPTDRIDEIQGWFDSVLAGDLTKRRRLTFLPGFGSGVQGQSVQPNIIFPKEVLLKDELDEWLMKIVCYAFSTSPQNMMKQMNRASAEQAASVAEEEGNEPAMVSVADVCNAIIHAAGMDEDYEFAWQERRDTDPVKAATVDNQLVGKLYTVNEIREKRGDDPRPEANASKLGVFGPQGFVPLDTPPPTPGGGGGQPPENPDEEDQDENDNEGQYDGQETGGEGQEGQQPTKPATKLTPSPRRSATKVKRVDELNYQHPVYGDLSKYDRLFAYDPETDTILVKGVVDFDSSFAKLKEQYPELSYLHTNGHRHV